MADIQEYFPREATTGMHDVPCLVFGNGVEIETIVSFKTTRELSKETSDGRITRVLPLKIGKDVVGTDIVRVHFLPRTSVSSRTNDPDLVPGNQRKQVALDCIAGFLSMAEAFNRNDIKITNQEGDDYYLLATTNSRFAAFLRQRCGFRGNAGGSDAWIRKSELSSEENIKHMRESYNLINGSSVL